MAGGPPDEKARNDLGVINYREDSEGHVENGRTVKGMGEKGRTDRDTEKGVE